MVPTVERGFLEVDFWSIDTAGESLDEVYVGLVDLSEEHTRVGGQRLNVAALTFREDGVEGEGGLTGAGGR